MVVQQYGSMTYGQVDYKSLIQVPTTVLVQPGNVQVGNYATQQFVAVVLDQQGNPMADQSIYSFIWSLNAGGTIDANTGLFTAQQDGQGFYTITATETTGTGLVGTATVEVVIPINCNDGTILPKTYVIDIIKRAMRLLQVIEAGETPTAQEAGDFLEVLNWMIEEWTINKTFCYYIENLIFPTTANQATYLIGPDPTVCDFVCMTPIRITSCYLRDTTPGYNNDWKLESITSQRYNDIFQKSILSSYPRFFYYEHQWPNGVIKLWPTPTKNYQLNVSQWHQFERFTSLQDVVCLPPGYKDVMALSLAVKMAPEYGKVLPDIEALATKSLSALRDDNYQPDPMDTDQALVRRSVYNIYSDRYW